MTREYTSRFWKFENFQKTLKKGIDKREEMMYNKQALVVRAQRTLKK